MEVSLKVVFFFFFFCGEYKGMVLIVASAGLSGQFCASKHEVIAA